jgi:hypothetical protein
MKTDSQNKITGFIIAVILMFLFFFFINSRIFAQNSSETGSSVSLLANTEYTIPLGLPGEFKLYQNYQNAETIRFDVPEVSQVKITIFDLRGAIIKGFLYDNIQPGTHQIDITDLQNGEYTYSMTSGNYNKSFSMSVSR